MAGDVKGGATSSAGDLAEAQYAKAKTSVWWDIENCQVPKGSDSHAIAQNISSALAKMNYCGPVSIIAYGDTTKIPSVVQQALSSTGITLNHVPAGVKDASDKKILVDMLLWAVDNPAPANYLLISGDRDFSNALHQLRMRRYNILLAQPQKASLALVAAAKNIWLWTSLSAGGPPMPKGESSKLVNGSHSEMPYAAATNVVQSSQPMIPYTNGLSNANRNTLTHGRPTDNKYRVPTVPKNTNQPGISRAQSVPSVSQENRSNNYSYGAENAPGKQFRKAPHEFFGSNEPIVSVSKSATNLFPGNHETSGASGSDFPMPPNQHPHPFRPGIAPMQPYFPRNTGAPPISQNPGFRPMPPRMDRPRFPPTPFPSMPNLGMLTMSEQPKYAQNPSSVHNQFADDIRKGPTESSNQNSLNMSQKNHGQAVQQDTYRNWRPRGPEFGLPSSSSTSNPVDGFQGVHVPSAPAEYIQGLMGVILLALNTLKTEKIMPTEANIKDCIRCGEHRSVDVKKALDSAVEQNLVLKQSLGAVQLYVGRNEKLWKCVNPMGGNPNQYPKSTWDNIQKFLSSPEGRLTIVASQSRYEAALAMRNACLVELALGDVLQILNMMTAMKKWITVHHSGWQPITITVQDAESEVDTETSA